ncbi:Protein of unknown function [Desulfoluna spongiiphila]|uniref:Uncharacterized protein n=1 Tax=Desulfoluna spongiiphila TaxID=419481 RepID=A0A1G5AQX3_9BACT|nr:Protein of unknown function [Desulfoluna spongiiphila]
MTIVGRFVFFMMCVVFCCAPLGVWAEGPAPEGDEGGFYGTAMLGGGVSHWQPSLLDAEDGNETITSLEDTADKETSFIPLMTLEGGYYFDSTGTWVSMDVVDGLEELETSVIGNLTVGQSLGEMGTMALSFSRHRTDVWKDPYLVGSAREMTKSKDRTLGLSWEDVLGLPVSLDVAYTLTRVRDDVSGKNNPDLKRDGETGEATVSFPLFFGERSFVLAGLGGVQGDFDGKSNSYDGYRVNLMYILDMDRWSLSSVVSGEQRRYDAAHPVFGKTREDKGWIFSTEYVYHAPLGYDRYFFQARAAMGETTSNISFFESSTLMVGAGIGYTF